MFESIIRAIVELRNDGYWTKGNRLLDALDGTSIAAVAMNWNGGITIRVYYQAEDLSLKEYCHDSGRGQYPGEWNHGKAPSRSPINAAAHEIDGELCIWVCWRNHQEEIVINKYHRFWGPVTRVVRSVPSDSQFALVQWVDGKYTQLRLYYQNDANLVCEQCSDDGGDNWWSGYKWGATRKVVLQLPHYARFFKDEQNLPQHELSLPSPEGKDGRYLWVSNQHSGFGWGNIFGPLCMMSLVAYLSNRAFVFEPYTWHVGDEPYVEHKHEKRLIVSRVPLTALISGPLAGGSFPAGDNHPRSVNKEFYKQVSEGRDVAHLSIKELNEGLEGRPAIEILEKYVQALKDASEDCVELFGSREHPFDYIQFGDAEIQTVYKQLSESPFITEFNWSSLVLSALGHNTSIICPLLPKSGLDLSDPELKFADPVEIASVLPHYIPDLLVLHVRRGDYERHWHFLCTCNSLFCGWNRVPGMGDVFNPKEEEGTKEEIYKKHAYPSDEQIVKKVGEVREKWETGQQGERKLCRLYIATNGTQEETAKLKKALRQAGAWDVIASTYDLALDHEQQYVAYAIDSAIAERAGVFIGTGFSSMSANINFMRRVHGLPLQSSRFW
ncbi:hypothetical protein BJ322DRAFT_883240 [Thelephora terrestris]|uniref:Fucose-specific lectin n=1 Tax=Thelephora terrestris TaxID=56493 RepID=A0A9P6L652_9AGAM|nr:hypothetical protein BJ322DRAFT_883240 [Thelephora terrestris]